MGPVAIAVGFGRLIARRRASSSRWRRSRSSPPRASLGSRTRRRSPCSRSRATSITASSTRAPRRSCRSRRCSRSRRSRRSARGIARRRCSSRARCTSRRSPSSAATGCPTRASRRRSRPRSSTRSCSRRRARPARRRWPRASHSPRRSPRTSCATSAPRGRRVEANVRDLVLRARPLLDGARRVRRGRRRVDERRYGGAESSTWPASRIPTWPSSPAATRRSTSTRRCSSRATSIASSSSSRRRPKRARSTRGLLGLPPRRRAFARFVAALRVTLRAARLPRVRRRRRGLRAPRESAGGSSRRRQRRRPCPARPRAVQRRRAPPCGGARVVGVGSRAAHRLRATRVDSQRRGPRGPRSPRRARGRRRAADGRRADGAPPLSRAWPACAPSRRSPSSPSGSGSSSRRDEADLPVAIDAEHLDLDVVALLHHVLDASRRACVRHLARCAAARRCPA